MCSLYFKLKNKIEYEVINTDMMDSKFFEKITFMTDISIEPHYLGSGLIDTIKDRIINKYTDYCNQEYGYIIDIQRDNIKIVDNNVSISDSSILFDIECTVTRLKPTLGHVFRGEVVRIFNYGVLLNIADKFKVIISSQKMGSYKYVKKDNVYCKGKLLISKGDKIGVIIEDTIYTNHQFQCTGIIDI